VDLPTTHIYVFLIRIWSAFVPLSSYQVFRRGAYYAVEVISGEVAVISLNTMYFYDSNKAVGGCEYREPDDPGNLEFDWLEVQLKVFRQRGMQVPCTIISSGVFSNRLHRSG
jgi:endopolyphosphatase